MVCCLDSTKCDTYEHLESAFQSAFNSPIKILERPDLYNLCQDSPDVQPYIISLLSDICHLKLTDQEAVGVIVVNGLHPEIKANVVAPTRRS